MFEPYNKRGGRLLANMQCAGEAQSGPAVIKLFSCLTQLCMKLFLLIDVKMPTIVGILTF